jgi:4-hydroxybenzoate polyprenyltransferase
MKRFPSAFFNFIVYSNLFIAICAILMVYQTFVLLIHEKPAFPFLGFVFFSTICSYSFHWYLTSHSVIPSERISWTQRNRNIHLILFFTGLAGCAVFFFILIHWWFWLLTAAFVTFLYSAPKIPLRFFRALRKIALGKTIFLALVWTYVTTILPIIITKSHWNTGFILFVISRFFFVYAICILFDYRDRQDDKVAGIRSLITYLNERSIAVLFIFSLIVFASCAILMLKYDYNLSSIILLLIPGIIAGACYNYARKNFSDLFYYFFLDGLMALSAFLLLLTGI